MSLHILCESFNSKHFLVLMNEIVLSYDVKSKSVIKPHIKSDNPLVD